MNSSCDRPKQPCFLFNQGIVPYQLAWEHQHRLVGERLDCPHLPDALLLLEHPPVYTLGTGANPEFVKFSAAQSDWELYRVERGGEVTYHCPGQLVGYPILNLRRYRTDLHWYLRQLEEVVIQVVRNYGLPGDRLAGLTGVWVAGHKIAAIGIKARRWVTMHGFSVNVCPDLAGFERIVPCGIRDKPVGSLSQFMPEITLEQVRQDIKIAFSQIFNIYFVES
ncbi:MAG: lipoyl(octanoyl) transferase LipB [Chloroflexaceae bacterium]|nr:lipoyl(octanoyl) transferase LipB [Chloroflexaceae bacterium]